jgi:hypothetical protein
LDYIELSWRARRSTRTGKATVMENGLKKIAQFSRKMQAFSARVKYKQVMNDKKTQKVSVTYRVFFLLQNRSFAPVTFC